MLMLIDSVRCGLRNLGRKRFRSVLTILGISIGVASVVLTASIGEIGRSQINMEIEKMGVGSILISVDGMRHPSAALREEDLPRLQELPSVESTLPVLMKYTDVYMRGLVSKCVAWGVGDGAEETVSMVPIYGRLFDQADMDKQNKVCIVDQNLAEAFYHRSNIVGKTIEVQYDNKTESYEIVGVVESGGNLMQNMLGEYVPSFLYLPYTTMQSASGQDHFDRIAVRAAEGEDPDRVGEEIITQLCQTSGRSESMCTVENMAKQKEGLNRIMDLVTLVLSAIAAISLVVAGLGIMTMMLTSVNERTKEIGIKKSIGASEGIILLEFLIEAFTVSLVGSIIGAGVGLGIVLICCAIGGIPMAINWTLTWAVIGFTVLLGVLFGVYPAAIAAKLRPVDALRFE